MRKFFLNLSLAFSAGALGGLVNSLVVWKFAALGITASLGVRIAPALTPAWLYPRLVWGGLWGFLFFIPILSRSVLIRGVLLSLGPTIVQLLIVFPGAHRGMLGLELGLLTPLFVFFFNAVWGVTAAFWLRLVRG